MNAIAFFENAFSALTAAAISPLSFIGYISIIFSWTLISLKAKRNSNLLESIGKFPEADRLKALEREIGTIKIKSGLTPEQWLEHKNQHYNLIRFWIVSIGLITTIAISAWVYRESIVLQSNNSKAKKNVSNNPTIDTKNQLKFHTNRIENQEFIFTSKPWPFNVDEFGEDINNTNKKLTKKRIVPRKKFTSDYVTIANKNIFIHFYIVNHSEVPIYLDTIFVEILESYEVSNTMFWNVWMPEMEIHEYEIIINNKKDVFEISKKPIKFEPHIPEHFSVKIMGDKTCNSKIYKINLIANFHDSFGRNFQIKSDKNYYIGFVSSNPFR